MRLNFFKSILVVSIILILPSTLHARTNKVKVYLFYSPSCGACIKLKNEYLPRVLKKYKDIIQLKELNIKNPDNLSLLVYLSSQYNKKGNVPSVLIGDDFMIGRKAIEAHLEELIQKYSKTRPKEFFLPVSLSPKILIEKFKTISVFTVISAGLIDGVNPCAFAVIIFFISFLSVYGYQRKELVYIGLCYVISVFITYVLIGLGLFKFLYLMKEFHLLMKMLYYIVASLCFLLALLALYDYFRFKKTKETDGLILQLPKFLKKRINLVIGSRFRERKYTRYFELCFISLAVGHIVSILEAACTGQVYLPTIVFILQAPHLRLKALMYLLLYNFMFIFPLIVIFALSLAGFSSNQFNQFLKRNLGRVKIIMALLFLVLGIFMLWLS